MKFLADENFNGHVFRALLTRLPMGSAVRVQDIGLSGVDDRAILEWAASNDYIVVTHDVATFKDFAYERIAASLPMPGVFQVNQSATLHAVVETLEVIHACSCAEEWKDRVVYLPF